MENLTHDKIARVFSSEQTTALAAALDEMSSSRDYMNSQIAKSALETTRQAILTARWTVGIFLSVVLAIFGALFLIVIKLFELSGGI